MGELGFDEASARALLAAPDETGVLATADRFENAWQQLAALGLAMGDSIDKIRLDLGIGVDDVAVEYGDETEDDRLIRALTHPAAKMQFTFVEDDEEFRRVIEGSDFEAWRVFLHPEQQRYATGHWNGPFRLTGGAGTGKTVVLMHRARHLVQQQRVASVDSNHDVHPCARRESGTRSSHARRRASIRRAARRCGCNGRRGVDQLAVAVRERAGRGFGAAAAAIFGTPITSARPAIQPNDHGWAEAIDQIGPSLPLALQLPSFFLTEYLYVVLPGACDEC